MKRALGAVIVLSLVGGAVWFGLRSSTQRIDERTSPHCGFSLCAHEAAIDVEIVVERCDRFQKCHLVPYDISLFIEFVDLDDRGRHACGPGECGAVIKALKGGWDTGRWRIVAPHIRRFPHLLPPDPIDLSLEEGETYEIQLVYDNPLNGSLRNPFAHN